MMMLKICFVAFIPANTKVEIEAIQWERGRKKSLFMRLYNNSNSISKLREKE